MKRFIAVLVIAIWLLPFAMTAQSANADEFDEDIPETVIVDEEADDAPDSIQFTFNQSDEDDIIVNSLTGYKLTNGAVLTLDYESTDTRDVSFFNPPEGDVIKKVFRQAIKPGHNTLDIVLNDKNLGKAMENESITMILGFDDKTSFLNFKVEELEELPVHEGTLPDSTSSIDYGIEASKKETLVVHSLEGYKVSNGIILKVRVTSPDARDVTLFNPPDGDKVMKTYNNKISKGENSFTIELLDKDVEKLREDDTVTMKLGLKANYTFLFFDTAIFDDLPVKEGSIKVTNELNYNTQAMKGDTFTVLSFKAFRVGSGFQFELIYQSPNVRSFSMFNPPNGNKIMKKFNNQVKKGKNKIILNLSGKEVEKIMASKELTFKFGFENKCTFIYLRTSELTDLPVKPSKKT
ncbi:hypothetical protein [Paenibacillus sp. OV219]|uniref:hypothetical protein n=1 Tax=Paenibacillus sp. OV219 TaxID=1884377 RepID=UPI000B860BC8|nr:hypothetical protein [Paenibacillus sp. OV219]